MRTISAIVSLVCAGCVSPDVPNGSLRCTAESACPSGYYCAADGTCWQNGSAPPSDMAGLDLAMADLSTAPAPDLSVPLDLATPDLATPVDLNIGVRDFTIVDFTTCGDACGPPPDLAGACSTSSDCANGLVCADGICASCASDSDCATLGAGYVCDLKGHNGRAGACVANNCASVNGTGIGACPFNDADFCCAGTCVAGNCCTGDANYGTKYCSDTQGTGFQCQGDQCTSCGSYSGPTWYVDPVNGSDSIGNGSSSPGCPFKTVHFALQKIANPASATTVVILHDIPAANKDGGGTIGNNVTVEGATATTKWTLPTNSIGISRVGQNSRLTSLVMDGGGTSDCVSASSPGTGSFTIDNTTLKNCNRFGLEVQNTATTIAAPMSITNSGSGDTAHGGGVRVTSGTLTIANAGATGGAIAIDGNTRGLMLEGGTVSITGNPSAGNVSFSNNTLDGIVSSSGSNTTSYSFNGVIVDGNGVSAPSPDGNGILIDSPYAFKLRNSTVIGNQASGVQVRTSVLELLDLGRDPSKDPGLNVLQSSTSPNGHAGICLAVAAGAGQALPAVANIFRSFSCQTTTSTLAKYPLTVVTSVLPCDAVPPGIDLAFASAGSYIIANCK